jgi:hypothetical protein
MTIRIAEGPTACTVITDDVFAQQKPTLFA